MVIKANMITKIWAQSQERIVRFIEFLSSRSIASKQALINLSSENQEIFISLVKKFYAETDADYVESTIRKIVFSNLE